MNTENHEFWYTMIVSPFFEFLNNLWTLVNIRGKIFSSPLSKI